MQIFYFADPSFELGASIMYVTNLIWAIYYEVLAFLLINLLSLAVKVGVQNIKFKHPTMM